MAKKTITNTTQDLQEFNKASAELVAVLNDLSKVLGDNAKAAERFTGDSAKNYTENFREAVSLGKTLSGYTSDQLKDRREETKFLKDLTKLQQEQSRIQSKIGYLQDKLTHAKRTERDYINESLKGLREVDLTISKSVEHAENLKNTFEEISKQSKFFDNLSDLVKDVPVLSKVFGEFQKASDAARNAAAEGKNGFAAGAKQLGGVFTKFIAAFTIGKIVSGLKDFDERTVAIGRNLNVSREESDRMVMSMNKAARSIQGLTGKDLTDSVVGFSNALGTSAVISRETAATLATQTKYLGMSSEEANSLAIYAAGTKQDYTEMVESITGEVILSNKRNKLGIDYKAITKDISKTSNATKALIQGQGKSLAQASIEAKKLGSNIEEIAAAGKNMLNFEESIAAELEAELLSGKEINNEKARAAALMGDQEALAKALQEDQALQKFDAAKTVLEQEAIAKAYGLQLGQMANMSAEAKAMAFYKVKDKDALNAAMDKELERITALEKQGKLEDAKEAMLQLQKDIGSKALIEQRENQTVADKQAEAMLKMGEAMDKLNIILKPIAAAFEFIGKNVELITKGLILMTALMGPTKLGGMVKNIGNMFKGMSGKVTAATTAATAGGGGIAGAAGAAGAGAGAAGAGAAGAAGAGAGGGGGFFKNLFSGAKNMVSKLNPFTALKSSIKGMGGVGGFLKTALKKIPGLNTILTGFFAYQDIKSLLENPIDDKGNPLGKEAINQQIGKIVMGGLGGILGGAVGTALGGPIGTLIGSIGGDALFKWIAGTFPDAAGALGGAVRPIFESSPEKGEEPRKFATGGIVSGATRAIVGEAGPEAVVPLREFYAKIDELIQAVKQGQNIYIGPNKLNESIGLNLHSVG
jgi:hypothetical protein